MIRYVSIARVAELAYAYDSKSYVLTDLWVQLPPRAQNKFLLLKLISCGIVIPVFYRRRKHGSN